MHTYFRPDADLMQIKLMHCRILADSMHTLRRANQCHYNAAARPRGASGEGGTLCDALLLPQEGKAAAREGEAEAREGKAAARDGKAEARDGESAARLRRPGKAMLRYARQLSTCSCLRRRRRRVRQGSIHLFGHPGPLLVA